MFMQVDWPINDMLNCLGPLVTGLHKQTVVITKWSFGQVPLYVIKIHVSLLLSAVSVTVYDIQIEFLCIEVNSAILILLFMNIHIGTYAVNI